MATFSPGSEFARTVYNEIRPSVPKAHWPADVVRATFSPAASGVYLDAMFDGFSPLYGKLASDLVRKAGIDLVRISPAALTANRLFRAQKWRDASFYALLPLLFAVPLMAALSDLVMHASEAIFMADLAALVVSQLLCLGWRLQLSQIHFTAEIQAPGMRLNIPKEITPQDDVLL